MTGSEQTKFYELLGERIKAARNKVGMKQEALAACIGLSRVSIVNIERGRQHPQIHLLWDIASTLKIEVEELLPSFTPSSVSKEFGKIIDNKIKEVKTLKHIKVDKKTEQLIKDFINGIIIEKPNTA